MARNIKKAPESAAWAFVAAGAYSGERAPIVDDFGSHASLDLPNCWLNVPEDYVIRLKGDRQ